MHCPVVQSLGKRSAYQYKTCWWHIGRDGSFDFFELANFQQEIVEHTVKQSKNKSQRIEVLFTIVNVMWEWNTLSMLHMVKITKPTSFCHCRDAIDVKQNYCEEIQFEMWRKIFVRSWPRINFAHVYFWRHQIL